MGDLSDHMLKQLAPDDEAIKACARYHRRPKIEGPTRRQRALHANRGGLTEDFLRVWLNLDPKKFHAEIGAAFNKFNKCTHLKPDTVITYPVELENLANKTIGALLAATMGEKFSVHLHDGGAGQMEDVVARRPDARGVRCKDGGTIMKLSIIQKWPHEGQWRLVECLDVRF